ncbi:MAG TPA: glycine cleavage system aminomethyltransferase GcvT [Actinopolymorphaceae bacterium]|nr:glycine cleavage system aminomethyltransferase GcvT [Actinopolymorphaceae bacterium]
MMRSPLHERHEARGAKFAAFGGWEMPLEYAGGGVLKEHLAVRSGVGVFDVSHLGKATVAGPAAAAYVDAALSNALAKIGPGHAQYTLCCDDASGGIVDDLIAYFVGPDEMFLVPNAANCAEVVARLAAQAPAGVEVVDRHESYAILAVQGPRSDDLLESIGLPAGHAYMSFVQSSWKGSPVTVCRTGYTGERGYELVVPVDAAVGLWDALLSPTSSYDAVPCGLGARDTLRTEMGYPLHGQDISLDVTPVQARLGWAVGWKKPAFWGRSVLVAEREAGPSRRLLGLLSTGRGIPRPGMAVVGTDGEPLGTVTSGTFSPTLRVGVGLALLAGGTGEGSQVAVDIRGRQQTFEVKRPPFVSASPTADKSS